MGIRIHKLLGYGLTDLECEGYEILDPRLKPDTLKWDYLDDKLSAYRDNIQLFGNKAYYLLRGLGLLYQHEEKFDVDFTIHCMKSAEKVGHCITKYDGEYIDDPVLIFTPPEHKEWYRHDNIIDYIEADPNCEAKLVDLQEQGKAGIYPYDGMYSLLPGRTNLIQSPNRGVLYASDYRRLLSFDKLTAHLQNDWAISMPMTIRLMSAYLGLFKDPATVFTLRPVLYTYWG
jgi:hypothetical protein